MASICKSRYYQHRLLFCALCFFLVGCSETVGLQMEKTWHQKSSWVAEDYFNDAQVIKLCHAIEANDLDEIDRLVKAGADVNAKGTHNMTPLLWAFPDNKLPRFQKLLELGADPNVVVESDFNSKGQIHAGHSVTYLVPSE